MKIPILLILTLFFKLGFAQKDSLNRTVISKNRVNAFNKDSIRFTAIDKGSQYFHFSAGWILVRFDGKYFGHANRIDLNYEYFLKNKYSLSSCLTVNYSYSKYQADNVQSSISFMGRRYFKIKKSYSFFAYSAFSLVNANLVSRIYPDLSFVKGGVTLANGIGFSLIPVREKKNRLGRFGFDASIDLLTFYSTEDTRFPYTTLSLKYRIN